MVVSFPLVFYPLILLSALVSISTRETHWPQISLMTPSHILALCVTTIAASTETCTQNFYLPHAWAHNRYPSMPPPISVASCSLCQVKTVLCMRVCFRVVVCVCFCSVYEQERQVVSAHVSVWVGGVVSQGPTLSLRQHECRPVSVWHSKREEQPAFTHTHIYSHACLHTYTQSIQISFCLHWGGTVFYTWTHLSAILHFQGCG